METPQVSGTGVLPGCRSWSHMASWHPLTGYHQGGETLSVYIWEARGPASKTSLLEVGFHVVRTGVRRGQQSEPIAASSAFFSPWTKGGFGVSILPDGRRKRREIEEGGSRRSRSLDKKSKEAKGFADS